MRYGETDRNRDHEVIVLLQADDIDQSDLTKVWMIIPSRWIKQWLLFAHLKLTVVPPGPINMFSLLMQDSGVPGGWRAKKTLLPPIVSVANDGSIDQHPGHYRRISLEVWLKLIDMYGIDGFALAVRGIPYDDKNRWVVFKNPRIIDINQMPEPVIVKEIDTNTLSDEKKKIKRFGLF